MTKNCIASFQQYYSVTSTFTLTLFTMKKILCIPYHCRPCSRKSWALHGGPWPPVCSRRCRQQWSHTCWAPDSVGECSVRPPLSDSCPSPRPPAPPGSRGCSWRVESCQAPTPSSTLLKQHIQLSVLWSESNKRLQVKQFSNTVFSQIANHL